MKDKELQEVLDKLPENARVMFAIMYAQITDEKNIVDLQKRVQVLEGNLATMRLKLSNLEKSIKKEN